MKKLKPCPFCGGKPDSGPVGAAYGVWCLKCGAEIVVQLPHEMPLGCVTLGQAEEQTLGEAKRRWEQRA